MKNARGCRFVLKFLAGVLLTAISATPSSPAGETYGEYHENEHTWVIGNPLIKAAFALGTDGRFRCRSIHDVTNARVWRASDLDPSSPINLVVDGANLNEDTSYSVSSYAFEHISSPAAGTRFSVVLATPVMLGEIRFEAEVYEGQPFIRYRTAYVNTSGSQSFVTYADMLSWKFKDDGEVFRDFFVSQWKMWREANFEPHETNISSNDGPVPMFTGAYADHTAWRAMRDGRDYGLITAWEFDGRALAHVEHLQDTGTVKMDAVIMDLNHRVYPGRTFRVPEAFIGVFRGDWDEAGYRTQRFAENVLAFPLPEPERFPYAMFDTWGYGERIDETLALKAAQRAAEAGAEVFILDLGWARAIGDWYPDPDKFPNGLRPLSDYVHSLGMKFGLHVPFLEAATDSPIIQQHPDWEAIDPDRKRLYFDATSLCPSHRPAREWIESELLRIITDYQVDWLTQDGDNMVKFCDSPSHSHAPGDSNYSNSVDGVDEIIRVVQTKAPGVLWENCEDGGSMQTFHMIQRYVTSIINDNDDALTTRRGVYGAIYPFPPRYTERYMMDDPSDSYHTRSYMFGGPFILMNKITDWSGATSDFAKAEIDLYKFVRRTIRDAKIYHLSPPPDGTFNDAMEAYDSQHDQAFIFVYGGGPTATVEYVHPKGLTPGASYWVNFLEVEHSYVATGSDLMQNGIPVIIHPRMAEVVALRRR
jgi:alpha-galactosidase